LHRWGILRAWHYPDLDEPEHRIERANGLTRFLQVPTCVMRLDMQVFACTIR